MRIPAERHDLLGGGISDAWDSIINPAIHHANRSRVQLSSCECLNRAIPKQWSSCNVTPLTFVHSPQSPLYTGPQEVVAANLDDIISAEKSDGGWEPA